ncbi:surface exclusion protein PrgA [Granulicella tundricola]|uniref:Surface exclusion protein PrgA n=1 Tax=Granulicella tundricola (strain ATCC BAA-1859 / DSM 23138 / MP5ACTX9) TaxID=1198114 RepID=E8WW35_GRATM|nr:surface exclusion protein PrgA [Granulicella tundricola]ADW67341.1 surface exclusion protein PrgA [Granulicella tundricola MP5ACTX9]
MKLHATATALLFASLALTGLAQTPVPSNTQDTKITKSDLKQQEKANKSQAKADKAQRKALNTKQQKKADKAQDKANREAAPLSPQ